MNDQIGRVLAGRYRLLGPIGAGASAQVFLAEDTRLRRRVAIKLLHESYADDAAFIRRFRSEAQTAAALNHPNLLAVFDWGEDDVPFLVTEFIAGGSLRAMLDQGRRLSVAQATLVGLQAARGLDHAHRQGLVHRDLKPANLLFGEDGRLRIADFGLARALADAAVTEPSGAVLGTARYASPEQAQGRSLSARSDVYSLALVLIEAVTGQVPFSVDTTIGTLMARVSEPIPVGSRLEVLAPVLGAAGRVLPEERPDAAALASRLVRVTEQLDPPSPLPLAGAIVLPDAAVEVDRDPTLLPEPGEGTSSGPEEAGGPAALAPAPGRRARRRHRRAAEQVARSGGGVRRWGRVGLLAALGVLVVAGGLAAYLLAFPEHEVPELEAQRVSAIDSLVGDLGFDVRLVGARRTGIPAGTVLAQDPAAGAMLREGQTLTLTVNRGPDFVELPGNLTNVTLGGGSRRACRPRTSEWATWPRSTTSWWWPGRCRASPHPSGGSPATSAVDLVVSRGPRPRTIPEDAVGRPFAEVAAQLEEQSLTVVREDVPTLDQVEGTVTDIAPGPGATVPRDSTVTVFVAVAQVEVPDVTGLDPVSAADALAGVGLSVSRTVGPPNRDVVDTDPATGSLVDPGSSVALYTRRLD